MHSAVARWGNSLGVRLPRAVAVSAHLSEGTPVHFRVEGEQIVMTRSRPRLNLDDLLAATLPEHRVSDDHWGAPVGKEAV